MDSLDWVADQPVVIYGVDDRRAWLVDGASALLHLVRASIERDRDRPAYRDKWKFNGLLKGSSAMEILSDPDNLNITIYVDDKKRSASGTTVDVVHSFRDRIQIVLHYLEALIDSQVEAAAQDGYWIQKSDATPTKAAVGFDFWDVAKPPRFVHRRVHTLRTPGYGWVHGWVDYVRSIGAMIIFGNNFGELIGARSADELCPGWKTVPTGAELMCCTIGTLKALQKVKGASQLGPGELTSGIVWSSRRQLFAPCPCLTPQTSPAAAQSSHASSHVDPVQFLLPKNKLGQLDVTQACVKITLGDLGELVDDGAAVFGHTPYHKTRPRLGYSRSSQEQADSRGGSSSGSGVAHTTMGDQEDHGPQSPSSPNTSQTTTQNAPGTGHPGDDDGILESRPRNPLKRLWDVFLRT
ncbi:hypothetical protein IMZ48_38580 [Candidatus Bathyarchaeota archaeon]|nr:hypothetical protein [Candidatus Bathyarchaeota archaeon]